jgi:hypothetical protein
VVGGILYPIIRSIVEAYDSEPDDGSARKNWFVPDFYRIPGCGNHQCHVPHGHGG